MSASANSQEVENRVKKHNAAAFGPHHWYLLSIRRNMCVYAVVINLVLHMISSRYDRSLQYQALCLCPNLPKP